MRAEIITIGDEILLGHIVNTNAVYICQKLTEIGVEVKWITVVGDSEADIKAAISIAASRSDVVISTGGLGPTHDDMTKKVFANYFNAEYVLHKPTLERIKNFFINLGVNMPVINEEQALVPENALVIENTIGTAPGLQIQKDDTWFFVLPGVPSEMKKMMESNILPFLKTKSKHFIKYTIIKTTGIGESSLFQKIGNIEDFEKKAKIAFLPKHTGVEIRLTAVNDDESRCIANIEEIKQQIVSNIQEYIWGYDSDNIEDIVAKLLIEKQKTLAVAEFYTAGLITNKLTDVQSSWNYFREAIVITSVDSLLNQLHFSNEMIAKHGHVSPEAVLEMAKSIRTITKADFGMAITDIKIHTFEKDAIPIGEFYAGFSDSQHNSFKKFSMKMDQVIKKERAAQLALDWLRHFLIN